MKAYWITLCQVTDDEGYGEYIWSDGRKYDGDDNAQNVKEHHDRFDVSQNCQKVQ